MKVVILHIKAVRYEHGNGMEDLKFVWGSYWTFLNFILHACEIMNSTIHIIPHFLKRETASLNEEFFSLLLKVLD